MRNQRIDTNIRIPKTPTAGVPIGELLLLLILFLSTIQLYTAENHWIFLDNVNLLIHEAGHLIFLPFGAFLHIIGGSVTQLLVPLAFFFYFAPRGDIPAISFCLFWIGNNLVNISVYIKDAQSMALPLIGGDHDWNQILSSLHLLGYDQLIGTGFYFLGILSICLSLFILSSFVYHRLKNKV